MKKIFILFFLLSGCASNLSEKKENIPVTNFPNNLTFEEFKIKLKVYANNNPYPNIDN